MFNSKLSSLQDRLARVIRKSATETAGPQIILDAMGGEDRIKASTGKNVLPSGLYNGVMIQTPVIFGKGVENVRIALNEDLSCTVTIFAKLKGTSPKVKKVLKNVELKDLVKVFEKETGTILK